MMDHRQPLLLEHFASRLKQWFQYNKLPFLSSLLWAALAYMFAFTNKLVNHDEVHSLFLKGSTVTSGRWGLGALDLIFPNVSMPWIYGLLTVLFIAVSICLLIRIFAIRSSGIQVLLSGAIMVFPSLIGLFGYMFTSCSYGLAFLLSVSSVWLLKENPRRYWLFSLGCLVLSLSIYQSYIAIAASVLVLILIQELLTEKTPVSGLIRKGLFYVCFLAASLGIYYLLTQAVLVLTDVSFSEYAGGGISLSVSSILTGIADAYVSFLRFFTESYHGLIPTALSRVVHIILLLLTAVLLWLLKPRDLSRCLLLAALLAVLPLAVNCMYVITGAEAVHTLVLYGFIGIYLLCAIAADQGLHTASLRKFRRLLCQIALNGLTFAMAVLIMINVYTANTAYLNLHLRYENAFAFYTSLAAELKQNPEFNADTRIAIIGFYQQPEFYDTKFGFLDNLTGVKGFRPDDYSGERFLEYYIGMPVAFVTEEEEQAIQKTEAFQNMATYPYYGSIQMLDNVLVIRME